MNKQVKFGLPGIFFIILMVFGLFVSCSDDIILEPLASLLGDYQGEYYYITNYQQPNQTTKEWTISWRFTDNFYFLFSDADNLCSPSGNYLLADNVEFAETNSGCSGVISNPDINPTGVFSIRQPEDSVILTQQEGTVFKEIRLYRVTD